MGMRHEVTFGGGWRDAPKNFVPRSPLRTAG